MTDSSKSSGISLSEYFEIISANEVIASLYFWEVYRMLLTLLIFFAIGFGVIWRAASEREKDYAKAISCMQSESIALVKARFEELGNYKESSSFVEAINLFQNGNQSKY